MANRFYRYGHWWYKTRKEVETARKTNETVYYDKGMKAYYIIKPSKRSFFGWPKPEFPNSISKTQLSVFFTFIGMLGVFLCFFPDRFLSSIIVGLILFFICACGLVMCM